ncbi:MAG: non-canonical purine NTP pyrophosphatase [Candidatus Diapherotrites archaeon]
MKEIHLVTKNQHKIEEMQAILKEFNIKVKAVKKELQEPDLGSLELIAEEKAKQAFQIVKKPVIVEDTGVYFSAYNNFPGTHAKRIFLGIKLNGLIALLKAAKNKEGFFKTVVCYYDGQNFTSFEGKLNGKFLIKARKPKADRLPYEKLFIPNGSRKALVELTKKEKNEISHRAIATRKFGKWFKSFD